jgi:iron complex outermembrane receptor protein
LSLGGRLDYEFYGGFQPSARVALAREIADNSVIYGSISRAFSMLPAASRFVNLSMLNGLARITESRSVDEVTMIAYELGYHGKFSNRLDTNLALYWNDYTDVNAMRLLPGPPGLIQDRIDNYASPDTYGVELDVKYAASRTLTLLGNYTYQQINWRGDVSYLDMDYMTLPRHKFMLGARYDPVDDLHLSTHLYYVDAVQAPNPANVFASRHVPPYFRLDLRAEYEFWNKQASVAVGVRNLLQENHYEGGTMFLNDAEVPRMIYAEMRLNFK